MLFLDSLAVSCQSRAMTLDIKICGLKTDAAMAAALAGGASHVGFIFFARSPRYIEPVDAGRLRRAAIGKAKAVAVTVDADDAFLDEIVAGMRPDMLQLHGAETSERVAELKARYGLPVMKVLSVSEAADLDRLKPYIGIADRFMFDAKPPKGSQLPGGNGVAFDWRILAGLDAGLDYMLSGGLNAANVGDALRLANPPGIDISSGVESAPGVKDPALIEQFFRAVRAARDDRAA
ncbi:phosphoribosylanthranilate isomerase [Mesorhizobium shonense]|uniref:N-(5'-phosphoribosyl)anthranilate isomerase n=2 Tax=Phyllobacteriaceae TaxID=69277 RepID=A0ABV2I5E5_9HYPH